MAATTLLLGTRKALLIYQFESGSWKLARECFLGLRTTYATLDPRSGMLWACIDTGHFGVKLHRSQDLGKTWNEIPAPAFSEGMMLKEDKAASVSYLWCLEPGPADQPQRLYLGTIPGGLFFSDDGGTSWQLNQGLWNHPSRPGWFGGGFDDAGIHSVAIDPRDSNRILVGVSVAGVFETTDAGATWRPRNNGLRADFLPDPEVEVGHDPHSMVMCRNQPDAIWQQNHCGIFRTTDGGANWSRASEPGTFPHFGFVVSADANQGDTAWVVPAVSDEQRVAVDRALCVCRTDDGGASWQAFRNGLPQSNCYDFAFRHGLDVDEDRLALGTACGAAYTSDDRGETWRPLGEHLPPIYSVRFA